MRLHSNTPGLIGTQSEVAKEFMGKNGSHDVPAKMFTDGKNYIGVVSYKNDAGDDIVEVKQKPISTLKPVFKNKYTVREKGTPSGTAVAKPSAKPSANNDPLGLGLK